MAYKTENIRLRLLKDELLIIWDSGYMLLDGKDFKELKRLFGKEVKNGRH